MIINTMLIIYYNINNYLFIICSNKKYTSSSEVEAFLKVKDERLFLNQRPIAYNSSKFFLISFILLQNISLFEAFENYLSENQQKYFIAITSLIVFIILLFLIINILNEYNYINFINQIIHILLFFCFYSIIFDVFLYISNNNLNSILYILIFNSNIIILSYITIILIHIKYRVSLDDKVREILFKEKKIKMIKH